MDPGEKAAELALTPAHAFDIAGWQCAFRKGRAARSWFTHLPASR